MLLRGLDAAPAVGRGRDLGALVALDLLSRHPELLCAAVALVDPPLYQLAPDATRPSRPSGSARERAARRRPGRARSKPGSACAGRRRASGSSAPARDHVAFFADYGGLATLPIRAATCARCRWR